MAQYMTNMQIRELNENPGQAIRMPATALLTIDTADRQRFDISGYRFDDTSPYNVYINTGQTLVQGFFTRIAVTELNMIWNIPNVISEGIHANNTLTLQRADGLIYTVSIGSGFYTPAELATEVQTDLVGSSALGTANWIVSYAVGGAGKEGTFFIRNTDSVNFRIIPNNVGQKDSLANMMGFGSAPPFYAQRINGSYASMLYTPYIDIVSQQLTKKQNVGDNGTNVITGKNVLARVYITPEGVTAGRVPGDNIIGTRPFTLYKEWQVPKQVYWDTKEFINVIDLSLVDYKGRVLYSPPQSSSVVFGQLNCGNSANYQLTLQITET
jgi:hypothetical protein